MSSRRVTVEPAAESEADWSSGFASSAGLPEFVEGEFSHMIKLAEGPDEGAGLAAIEMVDAEHPLGSGYWEGREPPTEQERVVAMTAHMDELLRVAGKGRDDVKSGFTELFGRFAGRWGDD